jgi:molybdopterin/thiamine biosynthesis adenylyltransferase
MELLQTPLERLIQERQLLADLENEQPDFKIQEWNSTATNELHLNFSLRIGSNDFNGVLVYPEFFPDLPAYIRPQKSGERWSILHQYGGSGVLCLEYGPDNWHSNITGVNLIKSAQILLLTDALRVLKPEVKPVPSRHSETIGQKLRGVSVRFIETPMLRHTLLSSDSEKMDFKVAISSFQGITVIVPTSIQNKILPDIVPSFSNERSELSGWAIRIDSVPLLKESVDDRVLLESFLGNLWPAQEDFTSSINPLLLYDVQGNLELFLINDTTPLFVSYPAINLHDDQNQRLPAQFSSLNDTRIAIVGLGSLGSKIAISLARSGCKNFLLIDDDILAPHNLVRNELNWLDVGFAKTYAVERALKRTALDMQVETYEMQIGGQENPYLNSDIANAIGTCNLIIDATANSHTFLTLAAIAKRKHIPMVWGEVFGGGGGAMMARSRPTLDATPLELRHYIYGVLQTLEPIPEGKVNDYGFQTQNQTYVASDADVSSLAASMTQFILDTLCTTSGQASAYPFSGYLIGFRKYWIFQCPFDTYPIDCSSALLTESFTNELSKRENGNSIEEPEPMKG